MKLYQRFSFVQLSIISSGALLLLICILLWNVLSGYWKNYSNTYTDIEYVELLDALEKVAHNHAVERGLTAGYLGSPSFEKKQKVEQQRVRADDAMNKVKTLYSGKFADDIKVQKSLSYLKFMHKKAKSVGKSIRVIEKKSQQLFEDN